MSQTEFHYHSAARTEVGCVRQINEDAVLALPEAGVWVVADGMGGHQAGDVASTTLIEALRHPGHYDCLSELTDDVEDRLYAAHARLLARGARDQATMGSTVAVLLAYRRQGVCLWAGDSRVYLRREGRFTRVTRDHSEVEELIARGELAREDAEHHPAANVITQAVGASEDLAIESRFQELRDGDRFLLCSDGLYKELNETEIGRGVAQGNCEAACDGLIQTALARGARDNVTVIVVQFGAAR